MTVKGFIEVPCTIYKTAVSLCVAEIAEVVPNKSFSRIRMKSGMWHDVNLTYDQVMGLIKNAL
jgi:hypothetical protein